jgi:hypothetical protein
MKFSLENLKGADHFEYRSVDGRIILKFVLSIVVGVAWIHLA